MNILETERLSVREITETDAEFILELLNQPSFIRYIGDRGIRSAEDAKKFIENRFRESYRQNGFGLYTIEIKQDRSPIGICGFVKRDFLEFPDVGFAFLAPFERKGYAFESANAVMKYGKDVLGLKRVLAITVPDNENSIRLLEKLGFRFEELIKTPNDNEKLKLFSSDL
jgi:RimJ/RimL family protein N-acetyltransferase